MLYGHCIPASTFGFTSVRTRPDVDTRDVVVFCFRYCFSFLGLLVVLLLSVRNRNYVAGKNKTNHCVLEDISESLLAVKKWLRTYVL